MPPVQHWDDPPGALPQPLTPQRPHDAGQHAVPLYLRRVQPRVEAVTCDSWMLEAAKQQQSSSSGSREQQQAAGSSRIHQARGPSRLVLPLCPSDLPLLPPSPDDPTFPSHRSTAHTRPT